MSFSLVPDYSFSNICAVTPQFLKEHGVRLLLVDMDNTIAHYGSDVPPEEIALWAEKIMMSGIDLFIVTNNTGTQRVKSLAAAFGVDYIKNAKKPFASAIKKALLLLGRRPEETALVGDQVYTDIIAANSAGILSIIVRPLRLRNPILNLRYWLEAPFRALSKNKML